MPPLAMARQKKNSRLRRIGPDSSSFQPDLVAGPWPRAAVRRGARGSTLPVTISSRAAANDRTAATRKPPFQPQIATAAITMAGVTPLPR